MPNVNGKTLTLTDIAALYYTKTQADARFPVLAVLNIFTYGVAIVPANAGTSPLYLAPVANQSAATISIDNADCGSSYGPYFSVGRNNNGSTPSAGWFRLTRRDGNSGDIWTDVSGNLRIGAGSTVTNATDTGGTVVGTQTSHISQKNIVGDAISPAEAMQRIVALAAHVKRFTYKSGSFNGEEFSGVILDDNEPETHRYGMDRENGAIPAGKSLNEITGFGDVVLALAHIDEQIGNIFSRLEAAGI